MPECVQKFTLLNSISYNLSVVTQPVSKLIAGLEELEIGNLTAVREMSAN